VIGREAEIGSGEIPGDGWDGSHQGGDTFDGDGANRANGLDYNNEVSVSSWVANVESRKLTGCGLSIRLTWRRTLGLWVKIITRSACRNHCVTFHTTILKTS
jgi:hypothetical protein